MLFFSFIESGLALRNKREYIQKTTASSLSTWEEFFQWMFNSPVTQNEMIVSQTHSTTSTSSVVESSSSIKNKTSSEYPSEMRRRFVTVKKKNEDNDVSVF